jgi:hypothetical protein
MSVEKFIIRIATPDLDERIEEHERRSLDTSRLYAWDHDHATASQHPAEFESLYYCSYYAGYSHVRSNANPRNLVSTVCTMPAIHMYDI